MWWSIVGIFVFCLAFAVVVVKACEVWVERKFQTKLDRQSQTWAIEGPYTLTCKVMAALENEGSPTPEFLCQIAETKTLRLASEYSEGVIAACEDELERRGELERLEVDSKTYGIADGSGCSVGLCNGSVSITGRPTAIIFDWLSGSPRRAEPAAMERAAETVLEIINEIDDLDPPGSEANDRVAYLAIDTLDDIRALAEPWR